MLRSLMDLEGATVHSVEREAGRVEGVYLDDAYWSVRYLVVGTGSWLAGKTVLVAPRAVRRVESSVVVLELTKEQLQECPGADTDKPVSRQFETEIHDFFGWPYYWEPDTFTNLTPIPVTENVYGPEGRLSASERIAEKQAAGEYKAHLRCIGELGGYALEAKEGEIGHVEDFVAEIDDDGWPVRYLVVNVGKFLAGHRVLLSTEWVDRLSWEGKSVGVDLTREAVENAPPFDPSQPVNRSVEERLYDFYGRPRYWVKERE